MSTNTAGSGNRGGAGNGTGTPMGRFMALLASSGVNPLSLETFAAQHKRELARRVAAAVGESVDGVYELFADGTVEKDGKKVQE